MPWLPANPNYRETNAEAARRDPGSVFAHFRALIRLRHEDAVVREGGPILENNPRLAINDFSLKLPSGEVNVTGNVALKTSEGLAHMVATFLREEFTRNWFTRLCALFALPVLVRFRRRVDSRRYNGASLLGLRGIVVKSHGGTDSLGFRCALEQAREEVHADVIQHITERVAGQLRSPEPVTEP